jgi:hypothetical protein
MQKKSVIIILTLVSAIAIVSLEKQNGFAALSSSGSPINIRIYNANQYKQVHGVDLKVFILRSGALEDLRFASLPPTPIDVSTRSELPTGSGFVTCAYYHDTSLYIGCLLYSGASTNINFNLEGPFNR